MSLPLTRASLRRGTLALACAPVLAALAACSHRSPAGERASQPAPSDIGSASQLNDTLRRRFPGIDVIRTTGGGFVIRILSGSAIRGEPLYIIDDAPVIVDRYRGIDWLRLEDVAQIRVLKEPSETTVYGPRAANGVIVITTKLAAAWRKRRR
jgi:TonB-dependent SusC/RagA subfamily outer membrane receptor